MIFDRDLEEMPAEDEIQPETQGKFQQNTFYSNARLTPLPSLNPTSLNFNSFEIQMALQTSLDKELHKHNANMVRKAILAFLKYCLNSPIDQNSAFINGNIFSFQTSFYLQVQRITQSVSVLSISRILSPPQKKLLTEVFQKYQELKGVFQELQGILGREITDELIYILEGLLQTKLQPFEQLEAGQLDGLVPRMQRFWGQDSDEKIIKGGWSAFNDMDYQNIRKLAERDIQKSASMFYFSKKLRYLILRSINSQIVVEEVNLVDKFTDLVSFISASFLLTMAGISQKEDDLDQFLMELYYKTGENGALEEDNLPKKIKIQ